MKIEMLLERLEVGLLSTNCYLVGCPDTLEGIVIDPGFEGKRIGHEIKRIGLKVRYIINTHGHGDHIGANAYVKETTGAQLLFHEADLQIYRNPGFGLAALVGHQPEPDRFLVAGEVVTAGSIRFQVMETPGHTPGGISLYTAGAIFTGDTLFAGSVGRTDLAGGSFEQLMRSIREYILQFPEDTVIYPGHGPSSTVGYEKANNPFLTPF